MAHKLKKSIVKAHRIGDSSHPKVVASKISKVIGKNKPRTRYLVGKYSYLLFVLRRILSDRMFDRLILLAL